MNEGDTLLVPGKGSDMPGGGDGGDVILMCGKTPCSVSDCGHDGDVIFQLANQTEILRLSHDGSIFVRGVMVDTDIEAVTAFKQWLSNATAEYTEPKP
jgi:hypothetical protein